MADQGQSMADRLREGLSGKPASTPHVNTNQPVLALRDVVVEIPTRHGVLRPVDGVSYDIHAGEILGVVGESGAGKSMAGNAVIGLLDPPARNASGRDKLKGESIEA